MSRMIQTPLPAPIQGKADWRKYKAFQLKNGVTCLVINDKESKTTAMSCIVEVGAASDPRELSGLAHFCEHMCFLGSEKYPGENEYKRYLASHGGEFQILLVTMIFTMRRRRPSCSLEFPTHLFFVFLLS
jgi:secreted Zn-dependent insulinase-like peptidase